MVLGPLEDVPTATVVEASGTIEFEGDFEIIPWDTQERRLRLGEDLHDGLVHEALVSALAGGGEQKEPVVVTKPFFVGVELQLTRTPTGYGNVAVGRVWHLGPGQRAVAIERSKAAQLKTASDPAASSAAPAKSAES